MNIDEIKRRNAHAGRFFFSKDTLSFFQSRVNSEVYEGPGGVFFVTSERYDSREMADQFSPTNAEELGSAVGAMGAMIAPGRITRGDRRYTVRQFRESGNVDTFGDFQGYASLYAAKRAALSAAAGKAATKEPTQ